MAPSREYGAAIFSPGLGEVLLIKHKEESGWAFPFAHTSESDVHVVAAASAVRQLLGLDVGDRISRTHWIEAEFPQTGALVRLYVALGVKPQTVTPRCAPGAVAEWHPLRSIFPPVNSILRADNGAGGQPVADPNEDEEGGNLLLEAGVAPFLAKLKALLNKHPEWRISQLDPNLMRLIQAAMVLPALTNQEQQQGASPTKPQPQQLEQAPGEGLPPQQQQQEGAGLEGKADEAAPQVEGQQSCSAAASGAGAAAGDSTAPSGAVTEAGLEPGADSSVQPNGGPGPEPAGAQLGPNGETPPKSATGDCSPSAAAADGGPSGEVEVEGAGGDATCWRGPRPKEHLLEYCRANNLSEPCYSLVVKKSARRPLVTASCILSHLGVTITPDMHVPGGINAACQAAALAALLWLEGALPPDGGEAVRVVPVGWPPLLSEARGESWEAAQIARKAGGARRELDTAQREALLREMDKKRQRLVEEAAELERLMAALRGGEAVPEPDISRLTVSLGLGGDGSGGDGGGGGGSWTPGQWSLTTAAAPPTAGTRGAKRSADGGDINGDGTGGLTVGLRALQFRSGSDQLSPSSVSGAATGGGGGGRGTGGGRAPGIKRPREDGAMAGNHGSEGTPGPGAKSVVMELKELCDRRRWPQPQYSYKPGNGPGAAAVVTLPAAAGLGEVSSGPQANRKRAKEAAAAAALAQLSALGLS